MTESNNAPKPSADNGEERLYTPAPSEPQLTFRAVITGCLLGCIVSAMNIYFGLRTGWSIGGSLIAAILGFAIFAVIKPRVPFSILETNITQTAGSAAGTMTSAAGLLAAIPALGMLGIKLTYFELTAWAMAVAYLGVFFAVPLRKQMVVVERLRFPTGTATAETILAMFSGGSNAVGKAKWLLYFGLAAAAFTLTAHFFPELGHPPMLWFGAWAALIGKWGFSILLSPLMTGAGILIGPRVGASLFAGALISWGILAPVAVDHGWVTDKIMSYTDGPRGWILWPGVAIMVADALTSLALSWRTVLNTFFGGQKKTGKQGLAEAIPKLWWMGGLAVATAATILISWWVFKIPPYLTFFAVMLSWILATIAVRSTGETDINPVGGMGKITQLVYGVIAPGQITTNLMSAGISGAGASQAADMMQDLKTGHLLGASPRKQMIAQLLGIPAGVLICVPIYKLFDAAYEIGGKDIPAPAAHAWKAMAELLAKGFDALPANATIAVTCGLAFGIIVPILRKTTKLGKLLLPSAMAFGIAFIVPPYYSIAMFVGSMLFVIWQKVAPKNATEYAFPVASGLIAGEGLMGVVTAILTLLGLKPPG